MKTIALANQKGGVGKTTSTINLAYALQALGRSVLMIDIDPQASLTTYAGYDPRELEAAGKTLSHVLLGEKQLADILLDREGEPTLIASSIHLSKADAELVAFGAGVLREQLRHAQLPHDFVLIDCPPTLSILTVNALAAADEVLVPVKTDFLSIMGIPLFFETFDKVRRRANPALAILGILPTLHHPRNTHDHQALEELTQAASARGYRVFQPVAHSTGFDKATAAGKPTLELYPDSPGVSSYRALAAHIVNGDGAR